MQNSNDNLDEEKKDEVFDLEPSEDQNDFFSKFLEAEGHSIKVRNEMIENMKKNIDNKNYSTPIDELPVEDSEKSTNLKNFLTNDEKKNYEEKKKEVEISDVQDIDEFAEKPNIPKSFVNNQMIPHQFPRPNSKKQFSMYFLEKENFQLPFKEGWLFKKSPHIIQGWQERYCRVKGRKFIYYSKKDLENPMGYIDFDLVTVILEEKKDEKGTIKNFKIVPKECKKSFIFKSTKGKEDIEDWIRIIKTNIEYSDGHKKEKLNLCKIFRFWRDIRISEEKFRKEADTLDILLFRSKNITSKLQRSLTGSHYDHVGIILRYGSGELVLLEATVGLCSWSTFMRNKWQKLYKKLIFRHLIVDRSDKMISQLEKYVKAVIGKKFSVSLKKLIKRKSDNDIKENLDNKTFFCSELVASTYKFLGLLPKELSASQYYPGNFSKEKKLNFLENAKLGEEMLIDFEI